MTSLSGKKAIVTGASGFIGEALARRLASAGVRVHGVSRLGRAKGGPCHGWSQVDLTDVAEVRRLLDAVAPDYVFHLAGVASATRDAASVLPILQANLVSTVNLLVALTERPGARLFVAGSLEEPQPGKAWPVATSPYAAAKFGAGVYARMFHALYGTPVTWLRLFMVYGPAQPDTRKLIPSVIGALLRGEAPSVSPGTRPVDWIYVDDVVDAFLAAAVAEGIEGRTLDVGSGELVTVREVVERIVRITESRITPLFGALPERPFEEVRAADVRATRACLGWRPRVSLEEGLRRTVEWHRAQVRAPAHG